ncbi:hypothetical protein ACLOJK_041741, partial [Asimina triloba]
MAAGGSGQRCRRTTCGRQLVMGGDAGDELIDEAVGERRQDQRQQGRQLVVAVDGADGFSDNRRPDGLRKKNARGRS